jgi:hypothetical protein
MTKTPRTPRKPDQEPTNTRENTAGCPESRHPADTPHPPHHSVSQSYRLGPFDESEVRWGLARDLKGDVGIKSSFGAFLNTMALRSKLARFDPGYPRKDADGRMMLDEFQSQVMECKGTDHRTLLTYEMSEEMMQAGSSFSRVWGLLEEIGDAHLSTLAIRYGHSPVGGLEAFDDLGALVLFTKDATKVHQRECRMRRTDPGIVGAAQALSARIQKPNAGDDDAVLVEVDRELWEAMYAEADARLSRACRAYVQASKQGREQERIETVKAVSMRRGRAR